MMDRYDTEVIEDLTEDLLLNATKLSRYAMMELIIDKYPLSVNIVEAHFMLNRLSATVKNWVGFLKKNSFLKFGK